MLMLIQTGVGHNQRWWQIQNHMLSPRQHTAELNGNLCHLRGSIGTGSERVKSYLIPSDVTEFNNPSPLPACPLAP